MVWLSPDLQQCAQSTKAGVVEPLPSSVQLHMSIERLFFFIFFLFLRSVCLSLKLDYEIDTAEPEASQSLPLR
jgi:hypothetical protein